MIICVKKVGQDFEFKDILEITTEDLKRIIGAKMLSTMKINEDITCVYDYDNIDSNKEYNFLILEEEKCDYDLKGAIKGNVVFVRSNDNSLIGLQEEDVDYLMINYMKNSCKDVNTQKYYDTIEIFA